MKGFLVAAAVTLAASAARADEIHVPRDVRRLSTALEMAAPGDTIVLGRGTWKGPVFLDVPGITLQGSPGTRLRAARGRHGRGYRGTAVEVSAPGVTVRGVTVVRGSIEAGPARGNADGFTLEDSTILRTASSDGSTSVYAIGADIVVRGNRFELRGREENEAAAIYVDGPNAVVSGNEFGGRVAWRSAVRVRGRAARVEANAVGPVRVQGIVVLGDEGVVAGNELAGADLEVWGHGGTISGNSVVAAPPGLPSVWVVGNGNLVEGNESLLAGDSGLVVWGNDNDLVGNDVSDSGADPGVPTPGHGIVIRGTGNLLVGNVSTGASGEGIRVGGSGGLAWDMFGNAIAPTESGNVIDGCVGTGAGACGLGNWLPGTVVTDSTFTGNGVDVVDGSGFDVFEGNDYHSGGPGFTGTGGDGGPLEDYGILGGPVLLGD